MKRFFCEVGSPEAGGAGGAVEVAASPEGFVYDDELCYKSREDLLAYVASLTTHCKDLEESLESLRERSMRVETVHPISAKKGTPVSTVTAPTAPTVSQVSPEQYCRKIAEAGRPA
jgi:hypothetical protein